MRKSMAAGFKAGLKGALKAPVGPEARAELKLARPDAAAGPADQASPASLRRAAKALEAEALAMAIRPEFGPIAAECCRVYPPEWVGKAFEQHAVGKPEEATRKVAGLVRYHLSRWRGDGRCPAIEGSSLENPAGKKKEVTYYRANPDDLPRISQAESDAIKARFEADLAAGKVDRWWESEGAVDGQPREPESPGVTGGAEASIPIVA